MKTTDTLGKDPLVSLIIPCFNQGRFLAEAIACVQNQTYRHTEIIVVDDGSTDHTRHVAVSAPEVKYFYQPNAGLSAARNHGVDHCNGSFVVFLDADDILYPEGISCNVKYLLEHPDRAFVSGAHTKVDEWLNEVENREEAEVVSENHFHALLRGNYIGMHGAVMYRRAVFDEFQFDTSLAACEDYDLYLKIARKYPVGCHGEMIAAYRRHGDNMSANIYQMFAMVRLVHKRQRTFLTTDSERRAWREGKRNWKHYYSSVLSRQLRIDMDRWPSWKETALLAAGGAPTLIQYLRRKIRHDSRRWLPDTVLRWLHRVGIYKRYTPRPGKIHPGDFDRVTPFSADFGFDRGGAIDRFYIEKFLEENRDRVRGTVLEIGDNAYTTRFGGDKVLRSDIFHVDRSNTRATYIGDIADVPQISEGEFDCIIFTQTLQLIYDFKSALRTCYRILKPGGCLLLTVPGISHIDRGEWRQYWLWSFTDTSIRKLIAETFNGSPVTVSTYGNVYVAAAFLYGMGLPEFRRKFLMENDPSYQVIISAAAVKA